jgi:hypothetical protein
MVAPHAYHNTHKLLYLSILANRHIAVVQKQVPVGLDLLCHGKKDTCKLLFDPRARLVLGDVLQTPSHIPGNGIYGHLFLLCEDVPKSLYLNQ